MTTPFEKAFAEVKGLVKEFEASKDHYRSSKYQESQVRKDYIDKFWKALGWDVDHIKQTNPREQEVSIEVNSDSISNRKVDYAFFLAPEYQRPVFLVEAKKPSVTLESPDYYFQTVRYGYNRSTSISILTDFQEFHVLDCRRKPEKSIHIIKYAKIKKYSYTDFLDRDKFGDFYWYFSREAIESGKLKAFWKGLPKPKGASKQLRLLSEHEQQAPPDDDFLADLDQYREKLAKAFKKTNPELTGEVLTASVQCVLDRLVFIRFLEDKLIEPDFIVDRFLDIGSAYQNFLVWSVKLNKKYNGIVFKPHHIDKPECNPPDDGVFFDICESMSHKESPYLLNYIPVEILGSIYERFLGKVIVAKGRGISVDPKPEVRKAGGVYYTPKYIVDYIVANTVSKILDGKSPKEIVKLRFADIACGSGSFLIAVFDSINKHLENWYNQNQKEAKKDGCRKAAGGRWTLSLTQKRDILKNNIYGVDIDSQAVEVAQLSLFLKLLETESISSTEAFQTELQIADKTILPDLSKNILCGNSLVGYDISDLFPLSEEDEKRINPFDFDTSFREIMNKGGFDAIVGNPPYFRIEAENISSRYLRKKYITPEFKVDAYTLFIEKVITLGFKEFGYIIPNTLMTNLTDRKLRKLILEKCWISEIVNYRKRVFDEAVVHNMLIFLEIKKGKEKKNIVDIKQITEAGEESFTVPQSEFENSDNFSFDIRLLGKDKELIHKIKNKGIKLTELCEIKQCIKTGDDPTYISDKKKAANYKPVLGGKDMGRYFIRYADRFVDYGPYLACPRDPHIYEVTEKILLRETGASITATFDNSQYYLLSSIYSVFLRSGIKFNLKYILGVINSKVSQYFMKQMCFDNSSGAFVKARIFHYQALPIVNLDITNPLDKQKHEEIVNLVDQMLDVKKRLATTFMDPGRGRLESKCEYLDRRIDEMVYELYGLTAEEIKVVEGDS